MRAWLLGAALGVLLVGPEPALGAREICGKTRLGATDACEKKLAKEAGVCQHTDKAGKKVRKKCKITCGLCDEVSPVPSPGGVGGVFDERLKGFGFGGMERYGPAYK